MRDKAIEDLKQKIKDFEEISKEKIQKCRDTIQTVRRWHH